MSRRVRPTTRPRVVMDTVMQASIVGGAMVGGCVSERRLFDVEIVVHEAESVRGVLDDDDVTFNYSLIPDRGEQNGNEVGEPVVAFLPDPAATTLRVRLDGFGTNFARVVGGQSAAVPLPDEGTLLPVPLLLAPTRVDALTAVPPALGPDVCVTDDGEGHVFIVGGSRSTQPAYVYDEAFAIRSLGGPSDAPAGVSGPGCGAAGGVVAIVGGCSAGALSAAVVRIDVDGTKTTLPIEPPLVEPCGAIAAPSGPDAAWVLGTDGALWLVEVGGTTLASPPRAGQPRALEVTASGAAVFVIDDEALWRGRAEADVVSLGPVRSLGRRGRDVLLEDTDNGVGVVEDRVVVAIATLPAFEAPRHFVLLDDDTVVSLRRSGDVLDVVLPDGTARILPIGVAGMSRVAALPGGVVVVGGADAPGLRGVSIR